MLPAQETPIALRTRALESMEKGKELYQNSKSSSDKVKGYQLYKKGLDMMIKYTKVETNPVIVKKVESAFKDLTAKAQEMKAAILPRCKSCNSREKESASKKSKKGSRSHSRLTARGPTIQKEKEIKHFNMDPHIESQVKSTILEPNIRWDDVAGLEKAKIALQEAVILPMKFPQLFTGCRSPQKKGILLFGAPGTGKTYVAKACAFESQAKFFFVSSSDIISKYVGDSERILKSIFETARANKPAIIFIDSIDSLFSARDESQYHWAKTIKTEFLIQMQNLWQEKADVLVLGETNSPWNLDSAVRRKFERRIYFPLPDLAARKSIFLKQFSTTPNTLTQDEIEYVASKTEGYSASDMVVLARDTLYEPLREVQNATHFKEVDTLEDGKPIYQACDPADPGAKKMSMFDLEGPQLRLRDLNMRDCEKALGKMARRSVLVSELERHEKFMQEYGGEG